MPRLIQTLVLGLVPQWACSRCLTQYGASYTLRLVGRTMVCFSEPGAVRQIFTDPEKQLGMSGYNLILEPIVEPESVLLLDGEPHGRHRKILMEPFRRNRIQAQYGTMAAVCAQHLERLRPGQRFSAFDVYERVTLEIILGLILGPMSPEALEQLCAALEPVTHVNLFLLLFPALRRDLGPLSPGGRFARARERLTAALNALIAERRAALERGESPPGLLTELVVMRDEQGEPMSDLTLRSMMMSTIIAGHETTAAALSWVLLYLQQDADGAGRLEAELDTVTDLTQLDELPWLDAVCREALRIAPVFPAVIRTLREPAQIGGYSLPAGTDVACMVYSSHRDPQVFEEPERFNPERFINRKYSPYSYYPFGGGNRMCIGWAFGLSQMKVLLAVTMRQLKLKAVDPWPPSAQWRQITWFPRGGGRFQVAERREISALG